jgi:chemotaxis response regulator CheB
VRIGIVNGGRPSLETLRRIVESQPGWEVAWTAPDGFEAVRLATADRPDLVLMDLMDVADRADPRMPALDGVEATRRIMGLAPTTILVVTSSVAARTRAVFEAMGHGAVDAVTTPALLPDGTVDGAGAEALVRKIGLLARLAAPDPGAGSRARAPEPAPPLVAIGASTGGPGAVATVLAGLPPSFPAAIAVVQHVDAQFAQGLADWLSAQGHLPVRLALPGQRLRPGEVVLAAGGDHMVLLPDLSLAATIEPSDCPYRPSVDAFLQSAAARWPRPAVAVLLTGMGRDGARGLLECRAAGWHTIAQDEATSVLYGMPRAAKEIGAAVEVLPLGSIAAAITHRVLEGGPHPGGAGEKEIPRR